MADSESQKQESFIQEKVKERPINRKKLFRRTMTTISMAILFGLVSCITILYIQPFIEEKMNPQKTHGTITFPEDKEEMLPEEMTGNQDFNEETVFVLSDYSLDMYHYKQLQAALKEYATDLKRYMVVITGIAADSDWILNEYESESRNTGVIIYGDEGTILILADYSMISDAQQLKVTFYNNVQLPGILVELDKESGLGIIAVDTSGLEDTMKSRITVAASLGYTNNASILGTPVVAVGNIMGSKDMDAMGFGIIASVNNYCYNADINYRILATDIYGSSAAGGILFDYEARVVGIITNGKLSSDMKNFIAAYGISDLRKIVSKMASGKGVPYLGIYGEDVTTEIHKEKGIPMGVFVTKVAKDSPAWQAGIQQGDIIININQRELTGMSNYTDYLMKSEVGRSVTLTVMRLSQNEYKEMTFETALGKAE